MPRESAGECPRIQFVCSINNPEAPPEGSRSTYCGSKKREHFSPRKTL